MSSGLHRHFASYVSFGDFLSGFSVLTHSQLSRESLCVCHSVHAQVVDGRQFLCADCSALPLSGTFDILHRAVPGIRIIFSFYKIHHSLVRPENTLYQRQTFNGRTHDAHCGLFYRIRQEKDLCQKLLFFIRHYAWLRLHYRLFSTLEFISLLFRSNASTKYESQNSTALTQTVILYTTLWISSGSVGTDP